MVAITTKQTPTHEGRHPPIIVASTSTEARGRRRGATGQPLPPRLAVAGLVLATAASVGTAYMPTTAQRPTTALIAATGPRLAPFTTTGSSSGGGSSIGSFLRPSSLSSLGRAPRRSEGTALRMARDLIDVKGLPKANIMRTNSSATAYSPYMDEAAPPAFDLSREVQRAYEDMVDAAASTLDVKRLAKSLPLPAEGVVSSAALIAGCMIGAGVLALPSVTVHAGVMPSTLAIATVWAYCAISGLLIGEVCINSKGAHAHASYLKIAGATVGKGLATLAFALFSVFQYFLLAAYISQGGALLDGFAHLIPGVSGLDLGPAFGPLAFTLGMGTLFTLCNQRALESTNNAVVTGVVASFAALLFAGMRTVDPALFAHVDFGRLQDVVPVAMCSLVFQNVVPVVAANLGFDRAKVMSAILLGSGVPAVMYLTWNAMVLGNVPEGSLGPHGLDLYSLLGAGGLGLTLRAFSLGAIATSFIGCFLSIVEEFNEFLRAMKAPSTPDPAPLLTLPAAAEEVAEEVAAAVAPVVEPVVEVVEEVEAKLAEAVEGTPAVTEAQLSPNEGGSMADNLPMLFFVLVPPVLCATVYPDGFLGAIETSGGFGDPFLFGLLPVIMAWRQRYGPEAEGKEMAEPLVPGGKAGLIGLGLFAAAMLLNKAVDVAPDVSEFAHHAVEVATRALTEAQA